MNENSHSSAFQVLVSCMMQDDFSIIERLRIKSQALIISQHDKSFCRKEVINNREVKLIATTERGLSRSRNMAILNSEADLCLFADDDEMFVDGYEKLICDAFQENPSYDLILFKLIRPDKTYPGYPKRIGYLDALRSCSCQIAFRRLKVVRAGVKFDTEMGSGTGNGGGEDNKFLFDCLSSGLNVGYVPITIASVRQDKSNWFFGYDDRYFFSKGWSNARIMGRFLATIYAIEFSIFKFPAYRSENTFTNAIIWHLRGIWRGKKRRHIIRPDSLRSKCSRSL